MVCMTIRGMLSGSVQAAPLKATATQHCAVSGERSRTEEPVYRAGSCVTRGRQGERVREQRSELLIATACI
jgi:hypothetical protein